MSDELEEKLSLLQPVAPQIDWQAIWFEQGRVAGRAEACAATRADALGAARDESLSVASVATAVSSQDDGLLDATPRVARSQYWQVSLWPTLTALSTSAALFLALMLIRQSQSDSQQLARSSSGTDLAAPLAPNKSESSGAELKSIASAGSESAQSDSTSSSLAAQLAVSQAISKPSWWDQLVKLPTPSLEWRMRFGPGVVGAREAWEHRDPVNVSVPVVAPAEDPTQSLLNFDSHDSYQDSLRSPRSIPNILGGWL